MNDISRIIFIQFGTLGDMILATPAFSLIKKEFPNAQLHVFSGRKGSDVLKFNPYVDKVLINNKCPIKLIKNIINLKTGKYDLYIDPKDHYSREGNYFAKITSSQMKIGFDSSKAVFDISVKSKYDNIELHYTQRVMYALSLAGIDVPKETPRPELFVDPNVSIQEKDFYLINVSAGKESRIWSKENWVKFLKNIDSSERKFILINMPRENAISEYIVAKCPYIKRYNTKSIHDVFALVTNSIGVITPDTALIHIASGFNKPILTMIGGYDENNTKFAPLSDKAILVKTESYENDIRNIPPERMIRAWKKFR